MVEHIRKFEQVDEHVVALPRGVQVHGVLKDAQTGLPIVMATFQMAVVVRSAFPAGSDGSAPASE